MTNSNNRGNNGILIILLATHKVSVYYLIDKEEFFHTLHIDIIMASIAFVSSY